jgi:hypothetical protein
MTAAERFVERIQAERAARGQDPTIQSPAVYRLLDAVLARRADRENTPETN